MRYPTMTSTQQALHWFRKRGVAFSIGLMLPLALLGCRDYLERKDTMNLSAGNAVAENKIVQTIDPWPPEAFKKRHKTDGKRLDTAIKRYEENKERKKDITTRVTTNR